jgi:hypothetical protein
MFDQSKSRPNLFERLGIRWCRTMHNSPMWPISRHYRRRSCGRSFLVPWASEPAAEVRIWIRPEQRVATRALTQ